MQKVELLPMPEVLPGAVEARLELAESNQQNDINNFGGFVVRGVEEGFVREALGALPSTRVGLRHNDFSSGMGEVTSLHFDEPTQDGDGFITAHHGLSGRARLVAAVFRDEVSPFFRRKNIYSSLSDKDFQVRIERLGEYTRDVAERGLWRFDEEPPYTVYAADTGPRDVVFFDHTRPHGVLAIGPNRKSRAIFQRSRSFAGNTVS